MGFVDLKLSDIELEKRGLGLGTYIFQLLPGTETRQNKFTGTEELNVSAAVAEGDDKGKRVWFTYPDPTVLSKNGKSMAWSAQALKKLEIALGTDALPGEDPATYLNRVASSEAARFKATVSPSRYIRDGETDPRPEFNVFSVSPAA